jgi:conjugal transfer pilus assembly protein TraW
MSQEMIRTKVHDFRPNTLHPLPAAKADKVFQVDMTYTLASDIPEGQGGVLYPKGFAFNPLDYANLTSVLVVINADDKRQVDWFKTSSHAGDYHTRLLLCNGDYYALAEQLKRPVFYLMGEVAKRLQLAAVPSVIRQNGKKLEVTEVLVPDE